MRRHHAGHLSTLTFYVQKIKAWHKSTQLLIFCYKGSCAQHQFSVVSWRHSSSSLCMQCSSYWLSDVSHLNVWNKFSLLSSKYGTEMQRHMQYCFFLSLLWGHMLSFSGCLAQMKLYSIQGTAKFMKRILSKWFIAKKKLRRMFWPGQSSPRSSTWQFSAVPIHRC